MKQLSRSGSVALSKPMTPESTPGAALEPALEQPALPEEKTVPESEIAAVQALTKRIRSAREKYKKDFERMRENMDFAAGIQWAGQETIRSDRYVVDLTLQNVNQKVATLYAKNPVAEFQRRKRLDFQLYDGRMESLLPILQQGMASGVGLLGISPEQRALLMDYQQGMQAHELIDRVGRTLEILYQWNFDEHDPDMKEQMKALVRRVITCGVAYVRVGFEREMECMITSEGVGNSLKDTASRIRQIMDQVAEGEIDKDDEQMDTLAQLLHSFTTSLSDPTEQTKVQERLVFDCLRPTAIIPDKKCRNLKGFVGCEEVAIEYILPLEEINAYFETKIDSTGSTVLYREDGTEGQRASESVTENTDSVKLACLFEVFNKKTKSRCFIVDGWEEYVLKPEALPQTIYGFWPIKAITFNDVETEPGRRAPLFPPSDVELMRHPQKEWNRSREELRGHRKANAPMYITMKNYVTQRDKEKITNAVPNELIELEAALPQGMTPDQLLAPKTKVAIDPAVYDTTQYQQDILLCTGSQEANFGNAPVKGTATGQTIAEQSRLNKGNSNVDDLDDLLSWMARVGGEISLQEFSEESVKRIVGQGAVWPSSPQDREDFMNSIYLVSKAASSGRPNKAVEINNWQLLAPILQAAGANPQFMVRETIRRADDQLDPEQAFPLMPTQGQLPASSGQGQQVPGHSEPPQQTRPGPGTLGPRPEQQQPMMVG